ncbi:hypothetical protein ACE103_28655 [Bradyrhizobium sp. ma5]|uniref:hypothetical protein n=1 Tax=Bradyrhizobium sp. ma5 TaxID=3344828 RepID=UPI0035D413F8
MTYLFFGLIAVWLFGLSFLASLNVRDAEAVLEHLAPGERYVDVEPSPWRAPRTVFGWLFGSLFFGAILAAAIHLFGRMLNLDGSGNARVTNIDPARLTEEGRPYLDRAIRNELILYGWIAMGIVLLVVAGLYFRG